MILSFSYGLRRTTVAVVGSALLLGSAHAETPPSRGTQDARIRTIRYEPDQVIRLKGYVGYHIHLEFAPGERFVNLGAGDLAALEVGAEGNHLMLKPKQERVSTNLTLITTERVYVIDYTAVRHAPQSGEEVVYSVKFTYPDAAPPAVVTATLVPVTDSARPKNLEYGYCGSRSLKPIAAWDDGVQTHLRFGARTEIPAVFVRNDDATESLVNFHIEGEDLVIHRVAPGFVLRRGRLVGCVSNRFFSGGGERLTTGTVSGSVERTTRGGAP